MIEEFILNWKGFHFEDTQLVEQEEALTESGESSVYNDTFFCLIAVRTHPVRSGPRPGAEPETGPPQAGSLYFMSFLDEKKKSLAEEFKSVKKTKKTWNRWEVCWLYKV